MIRKSFHSEVVKHYSVLLDTALQERNVFSSPFRIIRTCTGFAIRLSSTDVLLYEYFHNHIGVSTPRRVYVGGPNTCRAVKLHVRDLLPYFIIGKQISDDDDNNVCVFVLQAL